jgi:hypothetical protein
MSSITIYRINGGEPVVMDIGNDYDIKTQQVKEYISNYYGVDICDVKLYVQFSKNNTMVEKKTGNYFEGMSNKYLFSINYSYEPVLIDTLEINDSLDDLIMNKTHIKKETKIEDKNTDYDTFIREFAYFKPIFSSRRIRK